MSAPRPLVWVVATDETAARWARALEQAGQVALPLAWSEVLPLEPGPALAALARGDFDRVLVTSAYAVEVLPPGAGAGRPAACVGARAAEAAAAAGFEVREVGRRGAADVAARVLAAQPAPRRVLFLATSEAREEAVEALRGEGVRVDRLDVYRVAVRPAFATELERARDPAAVLAGSPRAVDALVKAAPPGRWQGVPCVAPGPTTGAAWRAAGAAKVVEAAGPTPEDLVAAVGAALGEGGGAR